MHIDIIPVGSMQANCYIISSGRTKNAIVIDPGADYDKIRALLKKKKISPKLIIHTHGHIDHIQADQEFNLPVYIHRTEAEFLSNPDKNLSNFLGLPFELKAEIRPVDDQDMIRLDDLTAEVIHTPGHTPGGICLKIEGNIFTGDTLFNGGVGRTDFPGASHQQLIDSIRRRLLDYPDNTLVYPGHGPKTTIGQEKTTNPFL